MFRFGSRSIAMLQGVHPGLVLVVSRGLLYSQIDFSITEGLRTLERQQELKAKGFSKTLDSKHLKQPDGYGHAIDVMAVGDLNGDGKVDHQDKTLTWDKEQYSKIAAAMQRSAGELGIEIRWGGSFKTFFDGPHFELVA